MTCLGWLLASAGVCAVDPLTEVQDAYKAGRTGEAMRRLDALIAARPHDARLRFQKGVMLVDQKRPNEAIALFQKLVVDYPSLPEPMNNLAVLYVERGDMEKARATLEAAIRSKPNYGTAFQNLGDLYTRMASRAYARALQIDDVNGAPKLALIRNLYELPEASPSDLLVAQAATATATVRQASGAAPTAASSAMAAPASVARKAPTPPAAATSAPPPGPASARTSAPTSPMASAAASGSQMAARTPASAVARPPAVAPGAVSASGAADVSAMAAARPGRSTTPQASVPPPSSPLAAASSPTPAVPKPQSAIVATGPAASVAASSRPTRASPPPPVAANAAAAAAAAAEDAEVVAAMRGWAAAWSRRDVNAYFSAYAPGFKGADASADAWQAARRIRIVGKASIKVELSAIKVEVERNVARAAFRQSYSAGALDVNSRKTLELVKLSGRWLIRKESVGG